MLEEQIDVTDPQGRFTGVTLPKSEVHADGLWHVCTHIIVTDGQGNVGEQFRGPDCKLMRNVWDFVTIAGHISGVEINPAADRSTWLRPDILHQAMAAGVREAAEEIGLTIDPALFLTKQLRFLGATVTNTLTNEGYPDRWWDRTISFNFMLVVDGFTMEGRKLEPGKVLATRMTHVDQLERVLRGESPEQYAERWPDHKWLLAAIIDTARRIAQGY